MSYYGAPGTGPQDGALCTYKIVPVSQLARLTDKISWVEAGTIQPFAIALQMTRQAGLKANQNVMILGGGCIGLLLGAISKAWEFPTFCVLHPVLT
jgi:threonine dehydrogenase-like Zn-dependent dehydrogenase